MRMLNVGCGPTFHEGWTNLDSVAVSPAVISCDVRKGLPFAADSFAVCYSSHVLEHLSPAAGERLLGEMHRVLEPGGIARIVVPDLELVIEDYRQTLHRVLAGEEGAADDYDWMVIQLLDQSVRRRSGGAMWDFWCDPSRRNVEFVVARAGLEAEKAITEARGAVHPAKRRGVFGRLRSRSMSELANWARRRVARTLVRAIAGAEAAAAFEEGLFRNSGEIHQWMYDRYSLRRVLERAGFGEVRVCAADKSRIPRFADYELDVVEGRVRKPDSLFMEAVKATRLSTLTMVAAPVSPAATQLIEH